MPAKSNTLTEAPYDRDGSLLHFAGYDRRRSHDDPNVRWLPNDPFHATLQLEGMRTGYSAKYVIWAPVDDRDVRRFPMFTADLMDLVRTSALISRGIVSGRWMVRKRGQNYGLVLLPD